MATGERETAEVNADFFAGGQHARDSARLDVFRLIWDAIEGEIDGAGRMLDVGNGGIFEYDTSLVGRSSPSTSSSTGCRPTPSRPTSLRRPATRSTSTSPTAGSTPYSRRLLYHHLVGDRADDIIANVRRAIAEAHRVLEPGGRLIVAESCVPSWFYAVERRLYPALVRLSKTPVDARSSARDPAHRRTGGGPGRRAVRGRALVPRPAGPLDDAVRRSLADGADPGPDPDRRRPQASGAGAGSSA